MLVRLIRILVFKHFRQQKQELNNEVKQQVYKQSLAIYLAIMRKVNQEKRVGIIKSVFPIGLVGC